MGNLCSNPSEMIQKLKSSDRGSIDSLDMILQRKQKRGLEKPAAEEMKTEQKDLAKLYEDAELRKQFTAKMRHEKKIKKKIDDINHIEDFYYNGDIQCHHKPNPKLLNAKVEINKTKNVYEKKIADPETPKSQELYQVPINPQEILSREIGYYTK